MPTRNPNRADSDFQLTPLPPSAPRASAAPPNPDLNDAQLVRDTLNGRETAYAQLVARYMNIVVGHIYNRIQDYHLAEDLAQDAFCKAYASLASLISPEKFGSWLLVIARHTCMDWLRTSRQAVSLDDLREAGHEPVAHSNPGVVDAAMDAEIDRLILEEIQRLRPDYRDIIVMKHIDKLSYKQIAELLGMTVSAVGEKLSRIRQILRKRLIRTVNGI